MRKKKQAKHDPNAMHIGDTFTIAGCGVGAKGQTVFAGRNIKTKRKCRVVKLTVYRVTGGDALPAVL